MAELKEFLRTFTVRQGTLVSSSVDPKLKMVEVGNQVVIGSGVAAAPRLNSDFNTTVGLAILDPQGKLLPLENGWPNPMMTTYIDGHLEFFQAQSESHPQRRMVVVMMQGEAEYRAIFANLLVGDPDQAGVWGADDDPGPTVSTVGAKGG